VRAVSQSTYAASGTACIETPNAAITHEALYRGASARSIVQRNSGCRRIAPPIREPGTPAPGLTKDSLLRGRADRYFIFRESGRLICSQGFGHRFSGPLACCGGTLPRCANPQGCRRSLSVRQGINESVEANPIALVDLYNLGAIYKCVAVRIPINNPA